MIESFQNKKAMLIGNGLNRLDTNQSFSWKDLLKSLKHKYNINIDVENIFKPFPLAFDEMQHLKSGENNLKDKLKNLKKSIREEFEIQLSERRGFNDYHQKLTSLNYDDILTTNYDYSLEKSIESNFINSKKEFARNKQEKKYSLKRCYKLKSNLNIWHIHGELSDSRNHTLKSDSYPEESIMIGYEHYTEYLEKIQENIKGKKGIREIDDKSLIYRIKAKETSPFWTDIFFTHNLDIFGQAIDFSENHLWWLFNYRANLIKNTSSENESSINNRIRFFYPKLPHNSILNLTNDSISIDDIVLKRNSFLKSKAIGEILGAFKVQPIEIECDSYEDFYNKLIVEYLE